MDPRMVRHLKNCKLNQGQYAKLNKVVNSMLKTCKTRDQLLVKFAKKCYGGEKDRAVAKLQAETFMEVLFGGTDVLMAHGPKVAVEMELKKRYPPITGKLIKAENISKAQKTKSINFCTQLHEPDDEKDLENHPMWTRKLAQYLVGPTLGVGGTAKVKLAFDPKTKKKVAMKILQPKYVSSAAKEIAILKKLRHHNIVRVYDHFENVLWDGNRTTVFAIEYANQGELIEYLMYTSKFEDKLARWFFASLIDGMEYCHGQDVIHRDLKHDNCLLGENFVLKITDFGFATHYHKDELMKTAIGTAQYAAPEVLAGKKYKANVDIFSMGVMLFIALAGSQPWRKADPKRDRWYKMVNAGRWDQFFAYHERSHTFSPDQKSILKGVLDPNPLRRWSIKDIRNSEWLNGKKILQNDVSQRLNRRKRTVDNKKYKAMRPTAQHKRKNVEVDIFSDRLPYTYFQPAPRLSFVTDTKAEFALEDIINVIAELKGTVTKHDAEKYKLTFHINKLVDTGMYRDGTKEKEYEKVRVVASVQMWTHPGQAEALEDRANALEKAEEQMESMTEEQKKEMGKNIPPIKSIAIFRAEGGGETRYLFPAIYSNILTALPANLISKDVMDDDDIKEE